MTAHVFVSHSHLDEPAAEALTDCLLSSLLIDPALVRCTSLPGHRLAYGQTIAEQLKGDIGESIAIFALLTRAALASKWVLFELGAAWALDREIHPILGPSVTPDELPGPLRDLPSVVITADDVGGRLNDSLVQVSRSLGLRIVEGGRVHAKLEAFIEAYARPKNGSRPQLEQAIAFELGWLLLKPVAEPGTFEASVASIQYYLRHFGIRTRKSLDDYYLTENPEDSVTRLLNEVGGALAARRRDLILYYECAANMLLYAAKNERSQLKNTAQRLPIPDSLTVSQADLLAWVNDIHNHFLQAL